MPASKEMNIWDYYRLLGVRQGASDSEIKRAYRIKAMEFHPDRNHSEGAHDKFVALTEAYQYLISHPFNRNITEEEYRKNYQAWVDYRRDEARRRAEEYAGSSYYVFKKSPLYKSTVEIEGATVFMGLGLSAATILFTLYGFFNKLAHAATPREKPSVILFVVTLVVGFAYLFISLAYLSAWIQQQKRKKNGKKS